MAGLEVSIDYQQMSSVSAALKRAPDMVNASVRTFLMEAVAHLQGEVQAITPAAHGTLRQSISIGVEPLPVGIGFRGVVGTSLAYAAPVELGSRPHMPPIAPLEDWARRKLGLRGKDARRAAWAIAMRIKKNGTPGVKMFATAWEANREQVAEHFHDTIEGIARRMLAGE